ncbi:hypothetical protein J437_LFUL004150 [Ladona fulva]|uniref:Mitochondrial ribosomal protein S17 n=1 Tax=Ladona fulva TaxID=123851 RepID=A0A8K0K0L5_LADFU|nr:hypothetical protein J437_LFUL004150 [Ladona fulva]
MAVMSRLVAKKACILLGECVPSLIPGTSKIRVKRLKLNENLLMYYKHDDFYHVQDPNKVCKSGDIVLIEELSEKVTTSVSHKLVNVIYPLGDITDPITKRKVVGDKYRDVLENIDKQFGESESRFVYEKAKSRGWQEDKRDFTHQDSYIKYHESEEDQPYAV